MCDETLHEEKHGEGKDDYEQFYVDASFITKKSFFPFIKGYPRIEYIPSWPKPHSRVYPKANSYYAFLEDTNPFTRFPAKSESRKYGDVRPHFGPSEEPFTIRDPYQESEARRKYLASKPTCFVVLGKPGLNTARLATMIADSWNCVLISPLHLIKQEIQQSSEKGKFLEDILRTGECLGPEIATNLTASRLDKRDVFHKGYVVEGLPLISNATLDYSSYPNISDENSSSRNTREKYAKLFDSAFQGVCNMANESEDNDAPNSGKDISNSRRNAEGKTCATKPNYEHFISSQIEDIFTTWPIKPTIIVYVMCPDADLVRKREYLRVDPIAGRIVDTSFVETKKNNETLFSHDKLRHGTNVSFGLYQELVSEERILDENRGKYLLKRVSDTKSNVKTQCAAYQRCAMPSIEKWTLLHNPENVIRVDGRKPVSLMFQTVIARLRVLPIQRVILPRRFADHVALELEDEFQSKSNEEAFQDLTNRETVSPLFPWRLSAWNFLCPVELARGRTVEGVAKHAVRFMNKIFFLSSIEASDLFMENPRTFLRNFSPRPTCKLAVFGPNYSGKSDLCDRLAQMLGGAVINVNEIDGSLTDVDSNVFLRSPRREILAERSDRIVEAIRNLPKEEIDVDVWRDGGYVVDGMYPNIDCWKIIVDSGIIFEDVVLLFDEDPYEYLLSKWHDVRGDKDEEEFKGEPGEYFEAQGGEEDTEGLAEYLRQIQKFALDWETMREKVMDSCRNLITCNIGEVNNVSKYVMDRIKDRYAEKARIMSGEEKERERDLADYIAMADYSENMEEEEAEMESEKETVETNFKEDNRRFGDTSYYCPVALLKYNVLWKGKEEFSAIFLDKIYHLSSAAALEEFIRGPEKLSLPLRKPLPLIPPLRVSIIGPPGSGKSTLADAISRECGLVHVDYFQGFTTYMKSRGMPSISHRGVIVLSTDLPDEVQLPEDFHDERYNSDTATIQTFVRNYWRTGSVLPRRMQRECLFKFFDGLYNETGVVLDQFPSCLEDVEMAREYYTVPEIILELRCSKDTASERMIPKLHEMWQENFENAKLLEQERYAAELEDYEANRDAWIQKMLNEISDERYVEEVDGYEYVGEGVPSDAMEFEDVKLKKFELEETWYRENPEPVLFTDWENFETAKQRIEQEFQNKYDNDSQKVDALRNTLKDESIPYVVVDAEESVTNVYLRVLTILVPRCHRNVSILEKIYTIDPETADVLLDCGYYLLSSFGRWCPVQLRRNEIPLQRFLPLETLRDIYPAIHRQYVYFFAGKDAQSAFLKSPLEYLEQDSYAPVIPFRLSIIGPPKCGKTTLAQRFAKKYGVKVVTRGAALRYIVKHFPWTNSAQLTESYLRAGEMAPAECVYRAVETYSIDPDVISQGFVLDGFPLNRKEYEELAFLGLQPTIILDLKATLAFCADCLSLAADQMVKPYNFSERFLAHLHGIWEIEQKNFRRWLTNFTQNVIELDAAKCKWYVWTRADESVCSRYMLIRSYFRESDYDKALKLKYMSVSPYEFKRRQSQFESYCPLCLYYENKMESSGPPPDHRGMVQFREHFYWICSQHVNEFTRNPQKYLPPTCTACLPQDRPRILTETVDLEHPCWAKRLQVGGYCLVTYVENLPTRKLLPGRLTVGILYKDNLYLFCTEDCRRKFFSQPDKYANVDIKFLRTLAAIDVKDLPQLGFLEQTVTELLIKGVNQISLCRPKLPGLSSSATAAVYIGAYLKAYNASHTSEESKVYRTMYQRIFDCENMIKIATRTMKKRLNPFVHVPIEKNQYNPGYRLSGQLSMLSSIYSQRSASISFRRTSPTQILIDPDEESSSDSSHDIVE